MDNHTKLAIISIVISIPSISFVVYGTGSNYESDNVDDSKLKVISSFYPLHEFSRNIGQEKIDATLLVPVGVEPHDWEPTIKDIQKIQSSDLIIINGLGFENWVDKIEKADFSGSVIDTSIGILIEIPRAGYEEHEEHEEHKHTHEAGDPHIWLNPNYAKIQVQNIEAAFSNHDPDNSEYYQSKASEYIKQLDLLDSKIRKELAGCKQDFIAFHDAFSYFADEYSLNQHTIIPSNNSHGEATAKTLENVISKAKELNIQVIFNEEAVDSRTSQVIANEIGGKVLALSPLEVVSNGDYISKMTENLENLKEALC